MVVITIWLHKFGYIVGSTADNLALPYNQWQNLVIWLWPIVFTRTVMVWLYVFGQPLYVTKYITKFWLYYLSYRIYDQTCSNHSDWGESTPPASRCIYSSHVSCAKPWICGVVSRKVPLLPRVISTPDMCRTQNHGSVASWTGKYPSCLASYLLQPCGMRKTMDLWRREPESTPPASRCLHTRHVSYAKP